MRARVDGLRKGTVTVRTVHAGTEATTPAAAFATDLPRPLDHPYAAGPSRVPATALLPAFSQARPEDRGVGGQGRTGPSTG